MPSYPNANLWSCTHQIQVAIVAAGITQIKGSLTGERAIIYELVNETIIKDANLQKQLLSEYKHNSKIKPQEYCKFLQDKKSVCTILYEQCDEATKTKIALGDNYAEDHDAGRLLAFIE